jgi:putative ABC transport system permease protein
MGLVVGIALSLAATRFRVGMLYGVTPSDPATFDASTAIITAVAAVAIYSPARCVMLVDPMVALHHG